MHTALIIESDSRLRTLIAAVVNEAGFNTLEASDGNEGLGMFLRVRPRFVFTDVLAPVTDGLEIIRTIRATNPDTIITAMLGNSFFGDLAMLQVARMLGANHTSTKFPPYTDVVESVSRVLETPHVPVVEQRMYYRFEREMTGVVQWNQACGTPVDCQVLNLSLGGAMLRTKSPANEGNPIDTRRFELMIRDDDGLGGMFSCVRTRLEHEGDDMIIGACFPNLQANGKKNLKAHLS